MNGICWNYRGLGGSTIVRALADMVTANWPQWVGLVETKTGRERLRRVQNELGFQNGFGVDSRGRSGGLLLWWRSEIDITVCTFSCDHIDAIVEGSNRFIVTIFYVQPNVSRRGESWNLLRRLNSFSELPWIIVGDFNEVLFGWEIKSRCLRGEWQMRKFREVLQDCGLTDLSFKGSQFTYSNRRKEFGR
ncbi:unnamed protein product [Rhodiola kirilowii]